MGGDVTETGLIIAEVAFLVLLYAFVWSVVRSSEPPAAHGPAAAAGAAAPEPPPAAAPRRRAAPVAPRPPSRPRRRVRAAARRGARRRRTAAPRRAEVPRRRGRRRGLGRFDLRANLDPRLIVEESPDLEVGRVIPLEGGITIGRSEAADLSIVDQFVSHMHARILRRGAYHFVEDLGSTNGTFLNDRRVEHGRSAQGARLAEDRPDDPPLRGVGDRRGRPPDGPLALVEVAHLSDTGPRPPPQRGPLPREPPACSRWPTAWAARRPARSPRRWPSTRSAGLSAPVDRGRRAPRARAGQPRDPAHGQRRPRQGRDGHHPDRGDARATAASTWCTWATRAPTCGATATLRQVTEDHSVVAELVRRGSITAEEAESHPHRNVITRALGAEPEVRGRHGLRPTCSDGDVVLLCSDGLSSYVPEAATSRRCWPGRAACAEAARGAGGARQRRRAAPTT